LVNASVGAAAVLSIAFAMKVPGKLGVSSAIEA
jgi:hypothetical protein